MALSVRTLIKEKVWTRLIRGLPVGVNDMPLKMKYEVFLSLKACCLRENGYPQSEFVYIPNYKDGKVTITKNRRCDDGESSE